MTPQILQASINTAGIALTMIGALLIAVDVTRQYKGHSHEPIVQSFKDPDGFEDEGIVQQPPKTKEYLKWESTNKKLMLVGLILIFLGGTLQILASWHYVNASK
jgi:uncharacterized membrane protein